jgi:hypothetical protein
MCEKIPQGGPFDMGRRRKNAGHVIVDLGRRIQGAVRIRLRFQPHWGKLTLRNGWRGLGKHGQQCCVPNPTRLLIGNSELSTRIIPMLVSMELFDQTRVSFNDTGDLAEFIVLFRCTLFKHRTANCNPTGFWPNALPIRERSLCGDCVMLRPQKVLGSSIRRSSIRRLEGRLHLAQMRF